MAILVVKAGGYSQIIAGDVAILMIDDDDDDDDDDPIGG